MQLIPPPPAVSIVYTAHLRGLETTQTQINEPMPFFAKELRGNLEAEGFTFSSGMLAAEGRYMWAPGGSSTVRGGVSGPEMMAG